MRTSLKLTLATLVLFAVSVSITAQNFKFGAKAGANFSVQSEIGDIYNNDDVKAGVHFGVLGSMYLNERFGLQAEVNYDQKGSSNDDATYNYDYVTVPVLAKLSLGNSRLTPLHFSIYTGPYAGILVRAEEDRHTTESSETIDLKNNTNNAEFGMIAGFEVKYPLKNNSIFLDFRFGLGLSPFDKSDYKTKNKYFGINLGFEF